MRRHFCKACFAVFCLEGFIQGHTLDSKQEQEGSYMTSDTGQISVIESSGKVPKAASSSSRNLLFEFKYGALQGARFGGDHSGV